MGALVGGWIALRDNGLVGGLDHDGPLALNGGGAGGVCAAQGNQVSLDHLRNASDDTIHIDRVRVEAFLTRQFEIRDVYTYDGTRQGGGATAAGQYRLTDPRRPADTTIKPHGNRGVSYVVAYNDSAFPRYRGATNLIEVRGLMVDYHVGPRHFRERGGVEARFECAARLRAA